MKAFKRSELWAQDFGDGGDFSFMLVFLITSLFFKKFTFILDCVRGYSGLC